MDLKLLPAQPTEEILLAMLRVRYPATYKEHLRNPLNGPKSKIQNEKEIDEVTKMYVAAVNTAVQLSVSNDPPTVAWMDESNAITTMPQYGKKLMNIDPLRTRELIDKNHFRKAMESNALLCSQIENFKQLLKIISANPDKLIGGWLDSIKAAIGEE